MAEDLSTTVLVGGITIHLYGWKGLLDKPISMPISVMFLLHGRKGAASAKRMVEIAKRISHVNDNPDNVSYLLLAVFDHRNHGLRLVNDKRNVTWKEGNDLHAMDLFTMQYGAVQDVSLLIDFLPSVLFPNDERTISQWMASGISLGGHAVWMILALEPRITIGAPLIGCPCFLDLMRGRLQQGEMSVGPPYLPQSFVNTVQRLDASSHLDKMKGKRICVLSGGDDKLVPWSCSEAFVRQVEEVADCKVRVMEGVGHSTPPEMIQELIQWLSDIIKSPIKSHL
ncbi:hypothetical protein PROFUN_10872 [Planoprotostelium fungivorum]|uniref:Peptidase S9 prolyl oligopeptidase catalytic domain-containing protein n=1 Tax=Planoprotostelium fungivorum TaxID=1890364 RepID=A0A2P6NC37_9EUKA|nr:hypothetical protein PROFUN_10872 [Planoprotostelium fungivorum]